MNERLWANLYIAVDAVLANRLRSFLTALGIIFGVGAVIAMLAIGNGAQQEILEQIKLVGVNNIVINPVIEQTEENIQEVSADGSTKRKWSPGLTLRDVASIKETLPTIENLSPEVVIETYIISNGIRRSAKLVGVLPAYFELYDFQLAEGKMFNEAQLESGAPVCIIGNGIRAKFFPTQDPVGKSIKVGSNWLQIIGVMQERIVSESSIQNLGIRDFNMDVYAPLQTVLVRYENRDMVTAQSLQVRSGAGGSNFSQGFVQNNQQPATEESTKPENYHQLDRLVIQISDTEMLQPSADVMARLLKRRHYGVVDFSIEIPELLLKQQQRTNDIFNYVLGAIAGISLLVGGIGIMNIMLASVLERIKEIGLRLSIGAKKSDIVQQFLFESVMISVSGGIIGVILGVSLALVISSVADIPTVISFGSIVLSFGVAATVGLIFGIAPARKAASQDPIASLRYE